MKPFDNSTITPIIYLAQAFGISDYIFQVAKHQLILQNPLLQQALIDAARKDGQIEFNCAFTTYEFARKIASKALGMNAGEPVSPDFNINVWLTPTDENPEYRRVRHKQQSTPFLLMPKYRQPYESSLDTIVLPNMWCAENGISQLDMVTAFVDSQDVINRTLCGYTPSLESSLDPYFDDEFEPVFKP